MVVPMVRVLSPSPSSLAHRILFLEMAATPKAASASKLLTLVRRAARVHHYSPRTQVAHVRLGAPVRAVPRPQFADGWQRNVGWCGRGHEGPQLMRQSLGGRP